MDDLRNTKLEAESFKKHSENNFNLLEKLRIKFQASEQDLKRANEDNERIFEEKEKMAEDLEYTRQQVEYYKRVTDLKAALNGVAEFPGLPQVLRQNNNSDPESTKELKRKYIIKIHEIDDSLNCPICFEPWSGSPEHTICSLACGHFYGKSCITNWINKSGTGSSKCPQCSMNATLKDIRNHYMPQTFVGQEKI